MQDWEEIIYENRNKLYGSYLLRKKHVKYLAISLLISVGVLCIPIMIYYVNLRKPSVYIDIPLSIPIALSNPAEFEKLIQPPPPESDNQKKESAETPPVVSDSVPVIDKNKKVEKKSVSDSIHLAETKKAADMEGSADENDNSVLLHADQMPEFIGGDEELIKFIRKNTIYPPNAAKNKIQGRVVIQFIVSKTGDITNLKLLSGINPELNQEALRVIGMLPKWIPGKRGGKTVSILYKIPVVFKL